MKKILLTIMTTSLLFASCTEKATFDKDNSSIKLSAQEKTIGPDGGTFDIVVESSEDWRVSGKCDWARPTSDMGEDGQTLTFEVDPSTSIDAKVASYKVFAGASVAQITINQTPSYGLSLMSKDTVNFTSNGAKLVVKVNTNIEDLECTYSKDGAEWITFEKAEEFAGNRMLTFNVDTTEIYISRDSDLTIAGEGYEVKVNIMQEQLDAVITEEKSIVEDLAARELTVVINSNVEYVMGTLPDWITQVSSTPGEEAANGLTPTTYVFSLKESLGSRLAVIPFTFDGKNLLNLSIKQQNPNPIWGYFTDDRLRQELHSKGLVLAEEGTTKVELLESALTVTSLTLGSNSSYSRATIPLIDGLEVFPSLTSLTLKNINVTTIDLSKATQITDFTLGTRVLNSLAEVKMGNCPVTELVFNNQDYFYSANVENCKFSGVNLNKIIINSSYYYVGYYDQLKSMDITECPNLVEFSAIRKGYYGGVGGQPANFKSIYVTAAQKEAIDGGTFSFAKNDITEIVVK